MGLAVTTVASGGRPVVDVAAGGLAVTEVAAFGLAVTKVTGGAPGLGVTFVSATGGPAVTTSYTNSGGQGNRTGIITVTTNIVPGGGNVTMLINGSEGNEYYWNAGDTNKQIVFDFGVGASKVIDEFTWTQFVDASHGGNQTFAGSNDNVAYTNFPNVITLSHALDVVPITNTTGYRYYRLTFPGPLSSTPYIREIKFKISP